MTTLLITNDDGIGAPALRPLAEAMRKLGRVVVAAPSKERSWIGKAISRHGEIEVTKQVHNGIPMWAVGGYPADCVQVGSFGLLDQLPDLVISGINIGANKGSAFSTGSGTIAAAIRCRDRHPPSHDDSGPDQLRLPLPGGRRRLPTRLGWCPLHRR